jgi:hypothetical protein
MSDACIFIFSIFKSMQEQQNGDIYYCKEFAEAGHPLERITPRLSQIPLFYAAYVACEQ